MSASWASCSRQLTLGEADQQMCVMLVGTCQGENHNTLMQTLPMTCIGAGKSSLLALTPFTLRRGLCNIQLCQTSVIAIWA